MTAKADIEHHEGRELTRDGGERRSGEWREGRRHGRHALRSDLAHHGRKVRARPRAARRRERHRAPRRLDARARSRRRPPPSRRRRAGDQRPPRSRQRREGLRSRDASAAVQSAQRRVARAGDIAHGGPGREGARLRPEDDARVARGERAALRGRQPRRGLGEHPRCRCGRHCDDGLGYGAHAVRAVVRGRQAGDGAGTNGRTALHRAGGHAGRVAALARKSGQRRRAAATRRSSPRRSRERKPTRRARRIATRSRTRRRDAHSRRSSSTRCERCTATPWTVRSARPGSSAAP